MVMSVFQSPIDTVVAKLQVFSTNDIVENDSGKKRKNELEKLRYYVLANDSEAELSVTVGQELKQIPHSNPPKRN